MEFLQHSEKPRLESFLGGSRPTRDITQELSQLSHWVSIQETQLVEFQNGRDYDEKEISKEILWENFL